ncbi:hypothetical protein Y788_14305 [Pantoea dispersa 625]|nr:hypothetical protein Y788_14305 [Pantoea dispersa 625]
MRHSSQIRFLFLLLAKQIFRAGKSAILRMGSEKKN